MSPEPGEELGETQLWAETPPALVTRQTPEGSRAGGAPAGLAWLRAPLQAPLRAARPAPREISQRAQATGITQLCWAAFGLLPSVLGRLSPRPSSTLSTLTVGWRGPGDRRILPWPCFPTCEAVGSVHLSLHHLTLSADAQSPTWEAGHLNIPACQTPRIPGPKPWSPKAPTARKGTSH